jgi:uncharacterized FlgJ-related protein
MRTCIFHIVIVLLVLTFTVEASHASSLPGGTDVFEFSSFTEVEGLFEERGYTPENWQNGIKEVPRLYLSHIPQRWRSTTSKSISVQKKKQLFFRLLGPLVLRANELILEERNWLLIRSNQASNPRLDALLEAYRVRDGNIEDLISRVDAVPPSLVLAQAAEESGWGTSRFADLGNALFGQWTYGAGIAPLQRRKEKGQYSIAAFDSPLDSIRAYLQNINSHPAYQELRKVRAAARAKGGIASGYDLARTLTKYSERGEDYVHSLHAIMRVNKLAPTDSAYLARAKAVVLLPIGEDSN